MTAEVKPWPNFEDYRDGYIDPPDSAIAEYRLALAAAWESRCRVAVEALRGIAGRWKPGTSMRDTADIYRDDAAVALAAIGELPPLPPRAEGEG